MRNKIIVLITTYFLLVIIPFFASKFIGTNCYAQWVKVSNGLGNNSIPTLEHDGSYLYAGTNNSGVYRSSNNGNSWNQTSLNDKEIYDIKVKNQFIYAATKNYGVYYTTNRGMNWYSTSLNSITANYIDFKNDTMFVGTTNGIYFSINNGTNWIQTSLTGWNIEYLIINQNYLFAGSANNGGVFKSINGGLNWFQTSLNNKSVFSLESYNNYIYAGTSTNGLYISSDYGQNWNPDTSNISSYWIDAIKHFGTKILVGTYYYGVFQSTNNGLTWTDINLGMSNKSVTDFCIMNGYIYASTSESGVWRRPLSEILYIKAHLEGFWKGTTQISDTSKIYLANSTSPYTLVDSQTVVLSDSGTADVLFSNASTGSYYIVIKHRNHLETWSSLPQTFTVGLPLSYDFTTAQSQAYGSNMTYSIGSWCLYGGDINGDGFVDGADMALLDNDLYNYVSGYVLADLNGDQFVDGADMAILDNNLYNYIGVVRPGGLKSDKETR